MNLPAQIEAQTRASMTPNELAVIRHLEKQGCFIDWQFALVWARGAHAFTDGDLRMVAEQLPGWAVHL